MKRYLYCLLLSIFAVCGYTQSDTVFWFAAPYLTPAHPIGVPASSYIYLGIATYNSPATVTISQPANPAFTQATITVPANSTQNFNLSAYLSNLVTNPMNTVLDKGLKITSTNQINAYYEIRGLNSEIYSLKGNNGLGTQFMIPMQKILPNASYNPVPRNSIEIVATENNTVVTITPTVELVGNHPAGTPFTITINAGQTYCVASNSLTAAQHMGGTTVTSNKPIAISVTDDSVASDYYGGSYVTGQDLVGDQLVPENLAGTHYVAINNTTTAYAGLTVYALDNNTIVNFNTGSTPVTSPALNRGESFNHVLASAEVCDITANKPILVFHITGTSGEAGGTILPQCDCTGSNHVSYLRPEGSDHLVVTIVTQSAATNNFLVNNSNSVITSSDFHPVPGNPTWSYCRKDISSSVPVDGLLNIRNSSAKFQLGIIDSEDGKSCTMGFFSDYMSDAQLRFRTPSDYCLYDTINFIFETNGVANLRLITPTGNTLTQPPFRINSARPQHSGMYYLMAEDTIGCHGGTVIDSVYINVVNVSKPDLGPDIYLCNGDFVTLNPHYPNPDAEFHWNIGETDSTLFVITQGQYILDVASSTASNSITCESSDSINVFFWSLPTVDFSSNILSGCTPQTVTLNPHCEADTFGLFYEWRIIRHRDDAVIFFSNEDNPQFEFNEEGLYDVQLVVTASTDCMDSLTKSEYLEFFAQPTAEFEPTPAISIMRESGGEIQFINYSDSTLLYNPTATFTWNFGDGETDNTTFAPTHTYSSWGDYIVTLTIETNGGCIDQISHYVILEEDLIFPNVITPNGDNINDIFAIGNLSTTINPEDPDHYRNNRLVFFDRWGKKVYEADNYDTYAKNGEVFVGDQYFDATGLNDGVYYFTFYFKGKAIEQRQYNGSLTVTR